MRISIFNVYNDVKEEITSIYTEDEIAAFKNFDEFWDSVDVLNAYEPDWEKWKGKGVKDVYVLVFRELTGGR